MKTAVIHYFTGTGNTRYAAEIIRNKLVVMGYTVSLINVEYGDGELEYSPELNVFMFPVYGFAPALSMVQYLRNLKRVAGQKAAVLCVCGHTGKEGGFHGQAGHQAENLLKGKGYEVFFIDFVSYPENWTQVMNPCDPQTQKRIFAETDNIVGAMAEKIGLLEKSINKCSIFNRSWSWLAHKSFILFGRRFMGKLFIADGNCIACNRCEKACPAKAIRMVDGKPRWNWNCELCNRCINICPKKSIQTSITRIVGILSTIIIAIGVVVGLPSQLVNPTGTNYIDIFFKVLLVILLNVIFSYLADKLFFALERNAGVRRLFELTFTKGFRRYTAPGFDPTNKEL